jgi:Uma2 family endonuclease
MINSNDASPFAIYLDDPIRMTLEEFEAFIEKESKNGLVHELLKGEVITTPIGPFGHSMATSYTMFLIGQAARILEDDKLGWVVGRVGVKPVANADTFYIPDVVYYSKEKMPELPDQYFECVPELVVEVIAKAERVDLLHAKIVDYLRYGTKIVWVMDYQTQTVMEYRPNNGFKLIDIDGVLDGTELLPDLKIPLIEIFEMI